MAGRNLLEQAGQLVKGLFVEKVDIYKNPEGYDEPNIAGLPMSNLLESGYKLRGTANYSKNLFTGRMTLIPESVVEIEKSSDEVEPA